MVAELKKQYDVVEVDPSKPITEKYDVLLAVQPSSLSPEAMDELCRSREERAADGHLRRSVSLAAAVSGRRRHGAAEAAAAAA